MSTSAFANLKKSSKKGSFESLSNKLNKKGFEDNSHEFWKLNVGSDGNGFAVIRFLPAVEGEENPVVKKFIRVFKSVNGTYFENCVSTLTGRKDPVHEATSHLWKSNDPADVQIARERKRQTKYIANILVMKDPAEPDNEGKVFKYEFGPAIFAMLDAAMIGDEVEQIEGFNPFDFWEGANFKLRAHKKNGGQRSYEKSAFEPQSALFDGDDAKIEAVWNKSYKLQDEIAESKFKDYETLKKRYEYVTGEGSSRSLTEKVETDDFDYNTPSTPAVKRQSQKVEKVQDDDDDLSQYASLLNDD